MRILECLIGVAMGNAIDQVKMIADDVIDDNDHDKIADYLKNAVLERNS